ncbi:hypothetical protein [Thalassospira lohafexi]|uniref:Uncharacterized protein n=1 Tax=Thalassospira lohafexi TaxID=744227 RepID=A0A2N3LC91_9PROT|nr:hypothetical protein [Thalassospira lohafexi]PKR60441.1 hypothetical protein COO92_03650 [Thalassospira lohafexi]
MPTGWIYGQHDRGLYIVQTSQKEKREEDIRLGRLFGQWVQNAKAWTPHFGVSYVIALLA